MRIVDDEAGVTGGEEASIQPPRKRQLVFDEPEPSSQPPKVLLNYNLKK